MRRETSRKVSSNGSCFYLLYWAGIGCYTYKPYNEQDSINETLQTNQTNVVTERIITPGGNLTKTIITIPSQDTWTTVDIDIDTEQEQPVDVHQVKLTVTPHSPELGLVLEGGRSQGIFICDVIAGGLAGGLAYPGLCQGHSQ